nr:purine-cytosine permease fcyb [Quercus suber]
MNRTERCRHRLPLHEITVLYDDYAHQPCARSPAATLTLNFEATDTSEIGPTTVDVLEVEESHAKLSWVTSPTLSLSAGQFTTTSEFRALGHVRPILFAHDLLLIAVPAQDPLPIHSSGNMTYAQYDVEKHPAVSDQDLEKDHGFLQDQEGAVSGETFTIGDSYYARAQRFAAKFSVELRAFADSDQWLSANMVVSSFALAILARSVFRLGAADAMLVVLFFNLIGITPVCYFSTSVGDIGYAHREISADNIPVAIFNVLACIGWSAVNSIVGAQLLHTVNSSVPGYAGILIISFCTLFVTLFGYKIVHAYEFWSWIPATIVFLIVLGVFAHSGDFVNIPWSVGTSELGSVLSFGAVIYGFATGWTSYAADYTVYQPANADRKKVFFWTWLGLIVPLLFTQMLGVAVACAMDIDDPTERYFAAYSSSGAGGLLGEVLVPHVGTFGKFCLVILALTIIANNCPNIYSVALTVQVLARWTQRVPRFIWTAIATGIYIAIAIPGYSHFEEALENFMDFIGYWLAIYEGVALADHFVFKRGIDNYIPEHYDQPDKLPPGFAAVLAFCFGVAGMVTGMSQVWFVGPIALHAGMAPFGGDVGSELGFAFSAVSYIVRLFAVELKFSKHTKSAENSKQAMQGNENRELVWRRWRGRGSVGRSMEGWVWLRSGYGQCSFEGGFGKSLSLFGSGGGDEGRLVDRSMKG